MITTSFKVLAVSGSRGYYREMYNGASIVLVISMYYYGQ